MDTIPGNDALTSVTQILHLLKFIAMPSNHSFLCANFLLEEYFIATCILKEKQEPPKKGLNKIADGAGMASEQPNTGGPALLRSVFFFLLLLGANFSLTGCETSPANEQKVVTVGLIDSKVHGHLQLMQRIITEALHERAGNSVTLNFVLFETDLDGDGVSRFSEFDACFEKAFSAIQTDNINYLCIAAEVAVDRSAPGSGPAIDKVSASLNALAKALKERLFISAGNLGVDNFFAHTRGITVVGATKKSKYYSDPARFRRTAYRILLEDPVDKKTKSHGTSQSTARALGYQIAADLAGHDRAVKALSSQ